MKTRRDIIKDFVEGGTKGHGGSHHTRQPSASIDGNDFYSYATIIARRFGDKLIWVSSVYYSNTTTQQQNGLVYQASVSGKVVVRSTLPPETMKQAKNLISEAAVKNVFATHPNAHKRKRGDRAEFGRLRPFPDAPLVKAKKVESLEEARKRRDTKWRMP